MKTFVRQLAPIGLMAAIGIAACSTASAATLTVTSTNGYGPGTLRDAIAAAQPGDTIVFDASLNGQTIDLDANAPTYFWGGIVLTSYSELLIDKSLTIQGPGPDQLAISGGPTRVFEISDGVQATISGLALADGLGLPDYLSGFDSGPIWSGNDESDWRGGAILNNGSLTLVDCTISNGALWEGYYGAGICNNGALTMHDCTVTNNDSLANDPLTSHPAGRGGGIANFGDATLDHCTVSDNTASNDGGDVFNAGTMTISSSTISGNQSFYIIYTAGGGISNTGKLTIRDSLLTFGEAQSADDAYRGGGAIANGGTVLIDNCEISANTSQANGGAIVNGGTMTINNSTISGNSAGWEGGGIFNGGTMTISYSEITGNSAVAAGGGIYNLGTLTISDSEITANSGGGIYNDKGGYLTLLYSTVTGNTLRYNDTYGADVLNASGGHFRQKGSTIGHYNNK